MIDDIYSLQFRELYNVFKQVMFGAAIEDTEIADIIKPKIKRMDGQPIEVPIHYLTEEWYNIYPHAGSVIISGKGRFDIETFMKDIDNREKRMRQLILDNEPEQAYGGRDTDG